MYDNQGLLCIHVFWFVDMINASAAIAVLFLCHKPVNSQHKQTGVKCSSLAVIIPLSVQAQLLINKPIIEYSQLHLFDWSRHT